MILKHYLELLKLLLSVQNTIAVLFSCLQTQEVLEEQLSSVLLFVFCEWEHIL